MSVLSVQPSLEQLVEAFARQGNITFERDNGGLLKVNSPWVSGTSLHGAAERMRVVGGMELIGRVEVDGARFAVRFIVERAAYDTDRVARIQMRAADAQFESTVELVQEARAIRGRARLIALHCHDIKDADTVIASVEAISPTSVILSTHATLRRDDVLELRARFGSELLDGEVQVVSVGPPSPTDPSTIEVRFCDGRRGRIGLVSRIFDEEEALREATSPVDTNAMRKALMVEVPDADGRRSLFGRLRLGR